MIETRPRVHRLGEWSLRSKQELDAFRPQFITNRYNHWVEKLSDPSTQRMLNARISDESIANLSVALGAFELGVWQVYRKVGYTDPEALALLEAQMNLQRAKHPFNTDTFTYHVENGFYAYVDVLDIAMRYAIDNQGTAPITPIEVNHDRKLNILQLFELIGVEEAAHSLFVTHHPDIAQKDFPVDHLQSLLQKHFQHPAERKGLKWKRNYALRFFPDVAQDLVDFENILSSGPI